MEQKSAVVTCSKMKEIERRAAEGGLTYYQMMENAGSGAADFILRSADVSGKRILVFCGKGNNGGDGFVVARKLAQHGGRLQVILTEGEPKTEDAIRNLELCKTLHIPIIRIPELISRQISGECWGQPSAELLIDAIYGTGFHGELNGCVKAIIEAINESGSRVFALDIPSGVSGDSGEADPCAVRAEYTLVFHAYKPAHQIKNAQNYCGRIELIDIGIPD